MLRHFSYIFIVAAMLGVSAWLGNSTEFGSDRKIASVRSVEAPVPGVEAAKRLQLLEFLDRFVVYEHYYRSVYGHFTKMIGRIGLAVPTVVSETYEIKVAEASPTRFIVVAQSEVDGKTADIVTIDQDYQLKCNFSIPAPRAGYLRAKALRHLQTLKESFGARVEEESGLFKGYFRYQVRRDESGRVIAFAVGIRPPVDGVQLEAGNKGAAVAALDEVVESGSSTTGQRAMGNVMSPLEEVYLAQKIFHGEQGRYAKDWGELSKIVAFRFDEKERLDIDAAPIELEPDFGSDANTDELVIEPINSVRKFDNP